MSTGAKLISFVVGVIVLIGVVLVFVPFTIVDAGEEAVITNNGAFSRVVGAGLHFMTPFVEKATTFEVRTQKEQADASAASKDLQTVNATVAVNYNINPDAVADLYTKLGTDYKARVIDPAIQEAVKASTAKYTAEELITKRDEVTTDIKDSLATVIKEQTNDIQVTGVSVVNFSFSKTFEDAIEAKVTAVQNALAAQNDLQASQFKAQAIKVTAEAANNDNYIHLQELEVEKAAIAKWDGKLPTQQVPGSAVPFLNLNQVK